ncbi:MULTISPECIES: universal stress protein [Mycolicibacterium]|uniref:universal stress protein n=1 Tax=Mycolicibacterium TaxID=1866885 RepID=UPI001CA3792B|nr:universal stress protein [Mycolicibacterium austroafricanum]QZT58185.1 universal stress protein [Mycolicibacterium austroafricanum]
MPGETTRYGIVVGVDGSPESSAALRWAGGEALLFREPVTLIYAVAPTVVSWPMAPLQDTVVECERQNAEEALQYARNAVASVAESCGQDIDIRTEVRYGPPVQVLVDASRQARMVVVGNRGRGALGRLALGSVSDGLIHHAHGAVTVVHTRRGHLPDPAASVLLGVDGSPASEDATALAFEEAERRGVDLVAVHVWGDVGGLPLQGDEWRGHRQQAEEVLAERLAGWQERHPDVRVSRHVEFDDPAHHLVDRARTAQLVVLGSHGRGGFAGMLLGSVSSTVARSVDVPVTVARPR